MPVTTPTPKGFCQLEGSHKLPVKGATPVKAADPDEKVTISLHIRRGSQFQANNFPDQQHWSNHSPLKHKPLSHQELGDQVGADTGDISTVTDYLKSKGLAVVEANAAKRSIRAEGTVKQMEDAFAVTLHYYQSEKQTYRGREGYIYLPEAIGAIVKGVFGLDNRPVAHRNATITVPKDTAVLTPPAVANLYKFPQGLDVSGQTVGILEFGGGYDPNDVISYCKGLGIKSPVLKSVGIAPAANAPAGSVNNVTYADPDFEVLLDVEVIATVAPGVNIVVYFAPNTDDGWINAFKTIVFDTVNNPSVFSLSWGGTESDWTQQSIDALHEIFQEASSMSRTIFVSSGDDGTDDGKKEKKAYVEYPASDPYITACGGTVISNVQGETFAEQVWNDVGASGGGISTVFTTVPDWQKGANIPSSVNPGGGVGRGVPDIAGNASPYSGYYLTIYGKSTSDLKVTSGDGAGSDYGSEGGTSAVAPLFAGLTALLNAGLGKPVGYLNPTLYQLINTDAFNPITQGTNAFNGAPGYMAGPGWNACTGLGSVQGMNLLNALKRLAG
jgi:kumamolisin